MPRYRCNTCGGEYVSPQRDGSEYFHACPPETRVRARDAAGRETERPIEELAGFALLDRETVRARRQAGGELGPGELEVLERHAEERAEARDENTLRREGDRGERRVIRREGRGTTYLGDDGDRPGRGGGGRAR